MQSTLWGGGVPGPGLGLGGFGLGPGGGGPWGPWGLPARAAPSALAPPGLWGRPGPMGAQSPVREAGVCFQRPRGGSGRLAPWLGRCGHAPSRALPPSPPSWPAVPQSRVGRSPSRRPLPLCGSALPVSPSPPSPPAGVWLTGGARPCAAFGLALGGVGKGVFHPGPPLFHRPSLFLASPRPPRSVMAWTTPASTRA